MRRMLSGVLLTSIAGLVLFDGTAPAHAGIDYPYCMRVYTRDQYVDCSFSTLAQCQATASGRPAMCYLDPFYKGKPGSAYYVGPTYRHNLDGIYDPYAAPAPAKRHSKRKHRPS